MVKLLLFGTVIYLLFGQKRIGEVKSSIGETLSSFRDGLQGRSHERDVTNSLVQREGMDESTKT